MFLFALIKLLLGFIDPINRFCINVLDKLYHFAAKGNSLWMLHVVGIQFQVKGEIPDHPAPIVVVNHQTWMDIPILHHIVTGHGPTLKFLIKRQLIWVPIVGWMCYALGFPRLNRGGNDQAKKQDLAAIKSASETLASEKDALLIFAEGTRFTPEKHANQQSVYKHLLTPRSGGLKIALSSVTDDTPVLDLTIIYKDGALNFWQCLGGALKNVDIVIAEHKAGEIIDPRKWLVERWLEKDKLF